MTKNEADALLGYLGMDIMRLCLGVDNYAQYLGVYNTTTAGVNKGMYLKALLINIGYNVDHILRRCIQW